MTGSIGFEVNRATGIIETRAVGMGTPEDTAAYFERLDLAVRQARLEGQTVRVLIDLYEAPVQTPETAVALKAGSLRVHRPEDRIAFVCRSMLLSLQLKRTGYPGTIAYFADRAEAIRWLLSEAPPPNAR